MRLAEEMGESVPAGDGVSVVTVPQVSGPQVSLH
jgi:hypothetical protein